MHTDYPCARLINFKKLGCRDRPWFRGIDPLIIRNQFPSISTGNRQKGSPRAANMIDLYSLRSSYFFCSFLWSAIGFCHHVIFEDSPKIEGIEGNWPLPRQRKILQNPATISWFCFQSNLFCLRHRGFDRVSVGYHAYDRVGLKDGPRLFVIPHFREFLFLIFALTVRILVLHTHTEGWTDIDSSEKRDDIMVIDGKLVWPSRLVMNRDEIVSPGLID